MIELGSSDGSFDVAREAHDETLQQEIGVLFGDLDNDENPVERASSSSAGADRTGSGTGRGWRHMLDA
jgi:hypothetical protein